MAKVAGKQKRKDSFSPTQQKRTIGDGRPAASYRETTRGFLETFPHLPTGPPDSGRRRRASDGELTAHQSRAASELLVAHSEMEDAVDETMELQQDDEDYFSVGGDGGDDDMFSRQSCGNSAKRSDDELRDTFYKSKNLVDLPKWGWEKILPLLHPLELAQLQQCCQVFNTLVQKDMVWRRSRSTHLPELPKPVFGLSEREMFRLLFARSCMLCESQRDIETYWPFRARCCKQCLLNNTTKVRASHCL